MTGVEEDGEIGMIDSSPITFTDIAQLKAEADVPQDWSTVTQVSHTTDAEKIVKRPSRGKAHTIGTHTLAKVLVEGHERQLLLDSGAACSVVGVNLPEKIFPDWKEKNSGVNNMRFRGCSEAQEALGVIELPINFPHSQGSVRIKPEFVVIKKVTPHYFILGGDFLSVYGIDIIHSREKYSTIGN